MEVSGPTQALDVHGPMLIKTHDFKPIILTYKAEADPNEYEGGGSGWGWVILLDCNLGKRMKEPHNIAMLP
jgi:hypothetical protein